MTLTDHERAMLRAMHYLANGAAQCVPGPERSDLLETVGAVLHSLARGDAERASTILRGYARAVHVAAQPVTTGLCRDCGSGIGYPHYDYCAGVSCVAPVRLVAPKDCDVKP